MIKLTLEQILKRFRNKYYNQCYKLKENLEEDNKFLIKLFES